MEHITNTNQQTLDQAVKGLVLGLLSWVAIKYDMPPEIVIGGSAVVAALLAWVSAKMGTDKTTASFVGPKSH
jgi:hypothetical protein